MYVYTRQTRAMFIIFFCSTLDCWKLIGEEKNNGYEPPCNEEDMDGQAQLQFTLFFP